MSWKKTDLIPYTRGTLKIKLQFVIFVNEKLKSKFNCHIFILLFTQVFANFHGTMKNKPTCFNDNLEKSYPILNSWYENAINIKNSRWQNNSKKVILETGNKLLRINSKVKWWTRTRLNSDRYFFMHAMVCLYEQHNSTMTLFIHIQEEYKFNKKSKG